MAYLIMVDLPKTITLHVNADGIGYIWTEERQLAAEKLWRDNEGTFKIAKELKLPEHIVDRFFVRPKIWER